MGKFNRHIHATRLAQTRRIVLQANAGTAADAQTYLQLDGEPWPQHVPGKDKDPIQVWGGEGVFEHATRFHVCVCVLFFLCEPCVHDGCT